MEKKYIIFIVSGVLLGLIVGFIAGNFYKNEKIKKPFYRKELTFDGRGDLPKYFVDAQVANSGKDFLGVLVKSEMKGTNRLPAQKILVKLKIAENCQVFLKRPKTQAEIYGEGVYEEITKLEIKLKDKKSNIIEIKKQILELKNQSIVLYRQEIDGLIYKATTSGNKDELNSLIAKKAEAFNSSVVYEPLTLSDIKVNDKVKIYSNEETNNTKVINALRIEVIR